FSSTKEEMDVKQNLGMHQKNVKEEQMEKESSQPIFSAIQEKQSDLQQLKLPKDYSRCIWCIRPIWNCNSNSRKTLGVQNQLKTNKNNGAMQKLPSLYELVDAIKDVCDFHEFYEPKDEWMIDQMHKKYFSNTFGITNIHQLLVGINKLESLANFLYYPKKRLIIIEDTGELITEEELTR
ncbi:6359_t:CDS:2, partial [Funneliformis geosporum]